MTERVQSSFQASWRQLNAIMWKNWLVKRSHPVTLFAEIMLPVFFMALLMLIKTITTVLTSPAVAYYCGQVNILPNVSISFKKCFINFVLF